PAPEFIDLTDYDLADYQGNDHSGNYGTVWTDFDSDGDIDLFIAKCRQFVNDPNDPRRINQLWVNDGNGGWTEEALERGLVLYEQSWTTDFADIDNDGDFDCLATNHSSTIKLLENDGTGYFTDITPGSGLEISGFFLQAKMDDFDNDGFVDLIYTGGDNGYFRNNGDGTFTEMPNTFPYGDTMHSFASGDVNRDGQLDVYASYGDGYVSPDNNNPDVLWLNDGNENHWIAFDLEGFESNVDAVGAKVILTGDFGTMVREVRGGESYGITCTFACRFGLGAHETVDQAVVKWPSGFETVIANPEIDQYHNVLEVPCTAEVTATATATSFCPGEVVTVTATDGFATYQWSNGDETASIEISEPGAYSVIAYDAEGCAGISNLVTLQEIVGNAPTIALDGDSDLCEGGTLTLTASDADNYTWSTGEDTQSIEVTTSGAYAVYSVDICGNAVTSDTLVVQVFEAPLGPPIVEESEVVIPTSNVVELVAIGENIKWYDLPVGGELLGEGASIVVGVDQDTTFWAEDARITQGESKTGGELSKQDGGAYHSNSARWLEFDVHEELRLNSVTLFANGTYERSFELINAFDVVLESTTVLVEDGTFVLELDWDIQPGQGYGLRCVSEDPQLWREGTSSDLNYPYEVGELLTITNSTAGPSLDYYYFFYEWVAEPKPIECASQRTPVMVSIVPIEGCIDELACNFNPQANIGNDSCSYECYGCTDSEAFNYEPSATIDDGQCIDFTFDCTTLGDAEWMEVAEGIYPNDTMLLTLGMFSEFERVIHLPEFITEPITGSIYAVISWDNIELSGLPEGMSWVDEPGNMGANSQSCIALAGIPEEVGVFDWSVSGIMTISVFGSPFELGAWNLTAQMEVGDNPNDIQGCTYSNASNFSTIASLDDGSCVFEGCMNSEATNFNPLANVENGSCEFEPCNAACQEDLDGDGAVGTGDLLSLLSSFGLLCEP
ncbi:CRTAC1 family protein, partial [Flavobacteriales bacterium]|nr:CRTAC1 family protein [Flavobacteriales bacterium]